MLLMILRTTLFYISYNIIIKSHRKSIQINFTILFFTHYKFENLEIGLLMKPVKMIFKKCAIYENPRPLAHGLNNII